MSKLQFPSSKQLDEALSQRCFINIYLIYYIVTALQSNPLQTESGKHNQCHINRMIIVYSTLKLLFQHTLCPVSKVLFELCISYILYVMYCLFCTPCINQPVMLCRCQVLYVMLCRYYAVASPETNLHQHNPYPQILLLFSEETTLKIH